MKDRKPNRLKGYDYTQDGYYYVTTCVKNRKNYFGEIINDEMIIAISSEKDMEEFDRIIDRI